MVQVQEQAILDEALQPSALCMHHWIIGVPGGPVSQGTCKKCGAEQEFDNYFGNPGQWQEDVPLDPVTSGAYFKDSDGSKLAADGWEE